MLFADLENHWSWRFAVGISFCFLLAAALLVRFVELRRWRETLGAMVPSETAPTMCTSNPRAHMLAGTVERAAIHLPLQTKCLARAVALQWRLRLSGIPSDLVIAFHSVNRTGEDGFHAWVEHAGEMLIGRCDRAIYCPVMRLSQGTATALGRA